MKRRDGLSVTVRGMITQNTRKNLASESSFPGTPKSTKTLQKESW